LYGRRQVQGTGAGLLYTHEGSANAALMWLCDVCACWRAVLWAAGVVYVVRVAAPHGWGAFLLGCGL
jgi:hypothetical protein